MINSKDEEFGRRADEYEKDYKDADTGRVFRTVQQHDAVGVLRDVPEESLPSVSPLPGMTPRWRYSATRSPVAGLMIFQVGSRMLSDRSPILGFAQTAIVELGWRAVCRGHPGCGRCQAM